MNGVSMVLKSMGYITGEEKLYGGLLCPKQERAEKRQVHLDKLSELNTNVSKA